MLVFELKLVDSSRFKVSDDANKKEPQSKCEHCGKYGRLVITDNDVCIHINEFQLATMLRVLRARNRDLYDKLNLFYDKVSDVVEMKNMGGY